jgi:hypothetical protein
MCKNMKISNYLEYEITAYIDFTHSLQSVLKIK